jgi:nitroreductase/NAD-dependent dihydropyrimidine dehydrogenase PreA subunit
MAIPTTRTKVNAQIILHQEKCSGCGSCVDVCKDFNLEIIDKRVHLSDKSVFGCIGCGHCMAVCQHDAIEINGREISKADLFILPDKKDLPEFKQLLALFQSRRSIREFKNQSVEPEKIKLILEAAATSPMGLPPSDVHVVVFDSREKNRQFATDYSNFLNKMKWLVSPWFLTLMRPFWGKTNDEMFKGFVKPLFRVFVEEMKKGNNWINYDAPLAMYFYGSPFTDPADSIVAATTAMYAAESLGLGTCMLGGIHPMIQYGKQARKLREKYGIKFPSREGLFVIFGYADVKYHKGIKRSFADINFY